MRKSWINLRVLFLRTWAELTRYSQKKSLGQQGEALAAKYLKRAGFLILARQTRYRRSEIDIVAVEDRTVVFVEVKTLANPVDTHPAEQIDRQKQRALTRGAVRYLKQHNLLEQAYRFDVIAISWHGTARQSKVEHFRNAFEPEGTGQMFM